MLSAFPAFDCLWTKRDFLEARLIERQAGHRVANAFERIRSVGSLTRGSAPGDRRSATSAQ